MNKITFKLLTPPQQFWYAGIMIDMILADGLVHVSEQKYLELIFEIFQDNPQSLQQLKEKSKKNKSEKILPITGISSEIATLILQDCVDVAIADAEFHEKEQALIYEIGEQLNLSQSAIECAIIQGKKQLGHIFAFANQ